MLELLVNPFEGAVVAGFMGVLVPRRMQTGHTQSHGSCLEAVCRV